MSKGGWREFDNSRESIGNDLLNLAQPKEKRQVRVQRIKAGKGGKIVTEISGLELLNSEAKKLLKSLKAFCGTGGTVKDGLLELQGDQVEKVLSFLKANGYRPKQSGG